MFYFWKHLVCIVEKTKWVKWQFWVNYPFNPTKLYALNLKSSLANRACERIVHQWGSLETTGKSIKGKKLNKDQSTCSVACTHTHAQLASCTNTHGHLDTTRSQEAVLWRFPAEVHTWICNREERPGKQRQRPHTPNERRQKPFEFPCFTLTDSGNKIEQRLRCAMQRYHPASD